MTTRQATVFRYACRNCGWRSGTFKPQCGACDAWDSLDSITPARAGAVPAGVVPCTADKLPAVKRLRSGLAWFDKATNGGLTAGQRVLLGGRQGGGKTRLCLQLAHALADSGRAVLFVTGEMSVQETRQTATLLGCEHKNILLTPVVDVDALQALLGGLKPRPALVVVDSLNMLVSEGVRGMNGSPGQLRAGLRLGKHCQQLGVPSVFLAHLNARDTVAGPRFIQHEVDLVALLTVEKDGSRRLRVTKNRQGPETETRLRMTAQGLEA